MNEKSDFVRTHKRLFGNMTERKSDDAGFKRTAPATEFTPATEGIELGYLLDALKSLVEAEEKYGDEHNVAVNRAWANANDRLKYNALTPQRLDRLREQNTELLAALEQAVEQLDADYVMTPLDGRGALIRKLRTALAKAKP